MKIRWTIFDQLIAIVRYQKVKKEVLERSILCDLGCGFNGRFLLTMSPYIEKGYGFDKKVDETIQKNISLFKIDDLEKSIPLKDNSVDNVTMLALLEHLHKPESVLQEVFRILKPGGKVILTTPSPHSKPLLEFLAFKLKIISQEEIQDHKKYFSKSDIRYLLNDIGYTNLVIKSFMFGFNQLISATKST